MSILSQEEIDALVNQLAAPEPAVGGVDAARKIKSFDFRFNKRLDKFSANQLQTLRTLHDNFTRLLNNSLSVYLRTRVEATIISIEQVSYGDFISSIGIPSILSIYSMDPLPGSGIVQVDLNLVFSIIDRLLGGPGWYPQKLRDLTDIERTLMQRFMARMLNSYRESWNYLLTLSLKIEALDSNPQFIPRIIPLDQIVALVTCELKIGDMSGVMNFCLPYLVLQSIGPQLSDFQWSPSVVAGRGMTELDIAQLARNVERAPVDVRVELGKTVVSLRDLIALQPGDLVMFDKPVNEPLAATVNDREKFKVFPGVNRDKLAVRVSSIVENEE
ncbi:MAG: flagellar motor switch protein FliM [Candidatus Eremiobacteraeota bacterium]|jgi:flagellar motor switch protein FliM|nr:flagellar motor switch protein FliM [Candidatus Eremiobacteraeota bacterium]MEA2719554.1 flagellar motor switch protein FliM [Candidatus Eremiobacteraeota bacterium]